MWILDYLNEEFFLVTVTGFHSFGKRPCRAPEGRRWDHIERASPYLTEAVCHVGANVCCFGM